MNNDQLAILTKYLMAIPEQKIKNTDEIYTIVDKIYDLFEKEKIDFGKGITSVVIMLANLATCAEVPKSVVINTFSVMYDAMKGEKKE